MHKGLVVFHYLTELVTWHFKGHASHCSEQCGSIEYDVILCQDFVGHIRIKVETIIQLK